MFEQRQINFLSNKLERYKTREKEREGHVK